MRNLTVFALALLLVVALPAMAGPPKAKAATSTSNCELTGTWFGGSDPRFQFTFTFWPEGSGRLSATASLATDVQDLMYMYTWWTPWQGEVVRTGPGEYEQWGISYWVWDHTAAPQYGVDGVAPELDIVHSSIEFVDCNTFVSTIDVYAAYFSFTPEITPFVDPVDASWLPPGGTIVETYHRMPTTASPAQNIHGNGRVRVKKVSALPPRKR